MYKGDISDFPQEIVEMMLERQFEQTGEKDITIFEKRRLADRRNGGFVWNNTIEGIKFWSDVLGNKKFSVFYEKYPKTESSHKLFGKELLEEAKRRYPSGTVYITTGSSNIEYIATGNACYFNSNPRTIMSHRGGGLLYDNGEWAKIVYKPTTSSFHTQESKQETNIIGDVTWRSTKREGELKWYLSEKSSFIPEDIVITPLRPKSKIKPLKNFN